MVINNCVINCAIVGYNEINKRYTVHVKNITKIIIVLVHVCDRLTSRKMLLSWCKFLIRMCLAMHLSRNRKYCRYFIC
jgi:hypothetical protein